MVFESRGWGRDWRDDEDASPSRPPLPFVADLVAKERERRQSISHRRPSVPMAIELSLSEVLGVQPSPLSLLATFGCDAMPRSTNSQRAELGRAPGG